MVSTVFHCLTYFFGLISLQYLDTWNSRVFHKTHRRYSSFPETQYSVRQNGRNKNINFKLLKQSSEGSQQKIASDASSSSAVSASENVEKVEREDTTLVQDDDITETKTLCEETQDSLNSAGDDVSENKECRTLQGGSTSLIITDSPVSLRPWCSLPNLTDSSSGNRSQEGSVIGDIQEFSLDVSSAPGRCSRLPHLRTGSQTCPSSPTKLVYNSAEISYWKYVQPEHFKSKDFRAPSTNSPASKSSELSPSMLQIDYSLDVHSETQPSANEQQTFKMQKCSRDWRPIPLKNLSKIATVKRPCEFKDVSGVKGNQKFATAECSNAETISGSSDTLNRETSKSGRESQPSVLMGGPELDRPCVRPSDLKLSVWSWDEAGGSRTETQDSSSAITDKGKQIGKHRKKQAVVVGSAPEYAYEWPSYETADNKSSHLKLQRKSFIESGGGGVLPMAMGFFPRPTEGQSLMSFLTSGQFSRPSAELDRENAHFSICEAMIAAIEQVSVRVCVYLRLTSLSPPPTPNL
jgi:hypothetical protein